MLLFLYALCRKCVSQLFYIFLVRYYCSPSTHKSPLPLFARLFLTFPIFALFLRPRRLLFALFLSHV